MAQRDGTPILIDTETGECAALKPIDLKGSGDDRHDEAWLQRLLDTCPGIFPIRQIEPSFGELVSVCRELPLGLGGGRTGNLDHLFLTPQGQLLLVEAKLWRNPEARRKVVAQALDYVAAVFRMDYTALEAAARRARQAAGRPDLSLHEIVGGEGGDGLSESAFVDAVSHNLRLGRAVVAVVGDGIREDVRGLAELLQTHAGHRFVFALVELRIHGLPGSSHRLVLPSVLAQTTLIERGVVRVAETADGAAPRVTITAPEAVAASPARRGESLSEDAFYEKVEALRPGLADKLRAFVVEAEVLGVQPEFGEKSFNLKLYPSDGPAANIALIDEKLKVYTSQAAGNGRHDATRRYNQTLADAIGGSAPVVSGDGVKTNLKNGRHETPGLHELLPAHSAAWLEAIRRYRDEIEGLSLLAAEA
jgi:hypothetical protein